MGLLLPRLLALWLFTTASLAAAAAPADEENQRIRAVILAQLEAFADDDADAAFDTATPGVREAMGHPGRFLAMVRGIYPMVVRPASVAFLEVELQAREAWQLARIVDGSGKPWLALFILERQPDGKWRIGGCSVSEMRGQPV